MGIVTGNVEIEIGTLELVGVPRAQRYAVAQALEQELARLVAARRPAAASARTLTSSTDAGTAPSTPTQLGRAAARAAFDALERGGRR